MRKLNFTHGYIKRAFCFVGVVGLSHCSVNNEVQGTSASSSQQKSESQDSHSANFALYSANVMPPMPMGMTAPIPQSYNAPTAGMPMPMAAPTAPGQLTPVAPVSMPMAEAQSSTQNDSTPTAPEYITVTCETYTAYKIGLTPYIWVRTKTNGQCAAGMIPLARTLTGNLVEPGFLSCYRDYTGKVVLMAGTTELDQLAQFLCVPEVENIGTTTQGQLGESFQPAFAGTSVPVLGR